MKTERIFYNETWFEEVTEITRPHSLMLKSREEWEKRFVFRLAAEEDSAVIFDFTGEGIEALERVAALGLSGTYILKAYCRYPVPGQLPWRPDFVEMLVSETKIIF